MPIRSSDGTRPQQYGKQHRKGPGAYWAAVTIAVCMIVGVWVVTSHRVGTLFSRHQHELHLINSDHQILSVQSISSPAASAGVSPAALASRSASYSPEAAVAAAQPDQPADDGGLLGQSYHAHNSTPSQQQQSGAASSPATSPASTTVASSTTTANSSTAAASSNSSSNYATLPVTDSSLAALLATQQLKKDPAYLEKLREAAQKPINIAVMTTLFWRLPVEHTKGCMVDGIPLDCTITDRPTQEVLDTADVLYYHVPSFHGRPREKAFPNQLRLAMSLESAAYYHALDDASFMCQFDAEMSYRTCAQVTNWYSLELFPKLFAQPPLPFEEKLHALAYVNSNCGAQSGRSEILKRLIALGERAKVPVHAMGACDRNKPWPPGNPSKIDVFRRYKFCVTMENSLRHDYMTEKLWDGLAGGCVPVYMGPTTAKNIIPDPNSFIRYDPQGGGDASTPEELDALMDEIGNDKPRYEAMLAWKHRKPKDQPNEVFKYLWDVRQTTGECFLCQFVARHRVDPKPKYTTCLFNEDWMSQAKQVLVPEERACPALHKSPAAV